MGFATEQISFSPGRPVRPDSHHHRNELLSGPCWTPPNVEEKRAILEYWRYPLDWMTRTFDQPPTFPSLEDNVSFNLESQETDWERLLEIMRDKYKFLPLETVFFYRLASQYGESAAYVEEINNQFTGFFTNIQQEREMYFLSKDLMSGKRVEMKQGAQDIVNVRIQILVENFCEDTKIKSQSEALQRQVKGQMVTPEKRQLEENLSSIVHRLTIKPNVPTFSSHTIGFNTTREEGTQMTTSVIDEYTESGRRQIDDFLSLLPQKHQPIELQYVVQEWILNHSNSVKGAWDMDFLKSFFRDLRDGNIVQVYKVEHDDTIYIVGM